MKVQREYWIDAVKVLACILVVLGHFFQSAVKAEIIPDSLLYQSFNQSIYSFHVPLFFICSGYLYQKYSRVNSISSWRNNVVKKLLVLGIPYVFFSIVTWSLKMLFSNYTNTTTNNSLVDTLLLNPLSPYWYLYCLFLFFVIVPTFSTKKISLFFLAFSIVTKIISISYPCEVSFFANVLSFAVWFVLGMCICLIDIRRLLVKKHVDYFGMCSLMILLAYSLFVRRTWNEYEQFFIGLCACTGILLLSVFLCRKKHTVRFLDISSKYTMPVYLMHTLFAAPWRILLLKFGINSPHLHIISGIFISFAGPIIAAEIMGKFFFLDFFLNPMKYIKLDNRKKPS